MKIISKILIVTLLILLMIVPIYASDNKTNTSFLSLEELIEVTVRNIPKYDQGIDEDSSNYYIGAEIPIYVLNQETQTYFLRTNAKFYPVFKENEVIFTISDMGGTRKISTEVVVGLNNVLNTTNTFALISNGTSCMAITDLGNKVFVSGDETANESIVSLENEINMSTMIKTSIPFTNIPSSYARVISMPIKSQHTAYTCWAACMASFIKKYNGLNLTSREVVVDIVDAYPNSYSINGLNGTTLQLTTVRSLLSSLYDISVVRDYPVTSGDMASIRTSIDNGNAIIAGWTKAGSNQGHVTVLYGYTYLTPSIISYNVMDPLPVNIGQTYTLEATSNVKITNDNIASGVIYDLNETLTYQ